MIPALKKSDPSQKSSIDSMMALTSHEMEQVNRYIKLHIKSPIKMIEDISSYLIDASGKRIRPMLTLSSAELCGYQGNAHIGIAACVELIHSATLFHDDVVDDGETRRNRISANKVWGNPEAVLVGDFLFARAFEIMVAEGTRQVLFILSKASAQIAEGEVHQLTALKNRDFSKETYLQVIRAKTGTLFEAACTSAGALAKKDQQTMEKLAGFGMALGIIFQICDDLLDYSAHQEKLGKRTGDDFREKKITLPIIIALQQADKKEKIFWERVFDKKLPQSDADFEQAKTILIERGILDQTIEETKKYNAIAQKHLDHFPPSPALEAMHDALIFASERDF